NPLPAAFTQPGLPLPCLRVEPERKPSNSRQPPHSRVSRQVDAFHRAFGLPRQPLPDVDAVENALLRLREALLDEEVSEYAYASHRRDTVKMADALGDIVYVAYG